MIHAIIEFSVRQKLLIGLMVLALIGGGVMALRQLPVDAVPDITNNQVQVVTISPSLAPQEVEQFITLPVEVALANLPNVTEIRSISRFGLSVVTIVFKDKVPILQSRQLVRELLGAATDNIPEGLGKPDLMPITTGLGEIFQYVLRVKPGYEERYDAMELRTIQDWIVKRQMAGIAGIIEISSFGGYLKQYEVAIDPILLQSYDLSIADVFDALSRNNQNSGGSYIEKHANAYYIRTEGMVKNLDQIGQIVVANRQGTPVLIRDVAQVRLGSPNRFGAMTMDGEGEAVGGITLMLKGANSSEAIANVHERLERVRRALPEGVELYPYLDRSVLVGKTIHTVEKNLLEGGLIVIFVLILLLGNLRAGLITASVIPLAMLFALIMMNALGVSANLMSLGAIDFGIVVDGAVIVVEGVLHALVAYYAGRTLTQAEMDRVVVHSSSQLFRSAVFGVLIILVVFVPVMTLTGIEGKMFRPMAMTFSFAILGALILSLTYVPMMAALTLSKKIRGRPTFADRLMERLRNLYRPTLETVLNWPKAVLGASFGLLLGAFLLFQTLGAEFIPTLEEGDLAMQMTVQPGSSLSESIRNSTRAEKILRDNFPEVLHVVSKIGTAEVPTDPMAVEDADIMIVMKPKEEWTSARSREELVEKMKTKLEVIAGASFEFTQPIQLRFNELMTGAKTDIAVKIFGEDTGELKHLADQAAKLIGRIPGAGDVKVEQTEGFPQYVVRFNREKIAEYGLNIEELNTLVRTAYAGEAAGVVFENERKFDLVVRLTGADRKSFDLDRLFTHLPDGRTLPLSEVASNEYVEGPMMISREDAKRRINIGVNVRNRDVASLVADIEQSLQTGLSLPPGYSISYGGQFENLEAARKRLVVAVPAALALIFILLYFTFGSLKYALMIFSAVPLSAIGGIVALWLRDMPFSISAGVGFIALFGVAVLNGIVLISYFNQNLEGDEEEHLRWVVIQGGLTRLRPVIMTAAVAALGFLPMAISTSNGAEVQKPLATVVIGGLITATLLTLVVLPVLYFIVNRRRKPADPETPAATAAIIGLLVIAGAGAVQAQPVLTMDSARQAARLYHPSLKNAALQVQIAELGVAQARQVPATEIDLIAGQFNNPPFDYNLTVKQGLGNIPADRQRREVAKAITARSAFDRDLQEHQVASGAGQRWLEWAYRVHRRRLLETQLDLYRTLRDKTETQFQSGEITRLDKVMADNRLTQHTQLVRQAEIEERQALNALLQQTFLSGDWSPPPGEYAPLPEPADTLAGDVFLAPLTQQVAVAQNQTILEQKTVAPSWRFGYFTQSIRPEGWLYQGVTAGVDIPLFRQAWRARTEAARLNEVVAANDLSQQTQLLARQREQALQQLREYRQLYRSQDQLLQEQARQLRSLAESQLRAGETDYFRYFQSLDIALQSELDRLDLLHRYNQAILAWEYWKR